MPGTDFVFDNLALPSLKTDKKAVPAGEDVTKWWASVDANGYRSIVSSVRTAIRAGQWHGLVDNPDAPLSASGSVLFRSNNGKVEFSEGGGSYTRLITRFNVMSYGAVGDGVTDDTDAINAAKAAAYAAGGGTLWFPNTGHFFGVSASIVYGPKWVDEKDVSLTAMGYPTPAKGYSSFNASSYDDTAHDAAVAYPHVSFEGEPGAGIGWIGSEPANETAILHYAAAPDSSSAASANIMNGHIRGLCFYGPDSVAAGQFVVMPETTAVTSNVSAVFVAGTAQLGIEHCSAYGVKRGFTTSDNYWGYVHHNSVFRCVDGFTNFDANAVLIYGNVVTATTGNGFITTGQGWTMWGSHVEGAPCAINVPSADDFYISHAYLEDFGSANTDTYIKLGQNGSGVNCTWGIVEHITLIPAAAAKHMLLQSCFGVTFRNTRFRFNNTTVNLSRVNDGNCFLLRFQNTSIPLDAYTLANHLDVCSFDGASFDPADGNYYTQPATAETFRLNTLHTRPAGFLTLKSNVVDGGSAVAHVLDTDNALNNAAAIHTSGRVAGAEKWNFNHAGGLATGGARTKKFTFVNGGTVALDETVEYLAINGNGGACTLNLPQSTTCPGRVYEIQRDGQASGNAAVIACFSGEDFIFPSGQTFVGSSLTLALLQGVRFISQGDGFWFVDPMDFGEQAPTFNGGIITQAFSTLNNGMRVNGGFEAHGASTFADNVEFDQELKTSGSRREHRANMSASGTLGNTDERVLCDATAGTVVVTLPAASATGTGKVYYIGRNANTANLVKIQPTGSDGVGRAAGGDFITLAPSSWIKVSCNGANQWDVVEFFPGTELALTGGASVTLDATSGNVVCDATSGNITVALPTASRTLFCGIYRIKKIDSSSHTVTVSTASAIDGSGSSQVLSAQNQFVDLVCNGSDYFIVGASSTSGITTSAVADGSTARAYIFDTSAAYTTAGGGLASFKNHGTEKSFVDKDGGYNVNGGVFTGTELELGSGGLITGADNMLASDGTKFQWGNGSGSPEGLQTAPPGSLFVNTDGVNPPLYAKATGTGNTGWSALGSGGGGGVTPSTKWDAESSTSPSIGSFTQNTESGISGGAFSVDTGSGNALKVTQTAGDTSWGHQIGVLANTPSGNDYKVRATVRTVNPFATTANRFVVGARVTVSSTVLSGYFFGFLATSAGGDNMMYLQKDSAGTLSALRGPISIATILPGLIPGDSIDLEIDVKGGWITCTINGVKLWKIYDATFATGTGSVGALPAQSGQAQTVLLCDYFDIIPHDFGD